MKNKLLDRLLATLLLLLMFPIIVVVGATEGIIHHFGLFFSIYFKEIKEGSNEVL